MNDSSPSIDKEEIQRRAYARWLERGCPDGSAEVDWFLAEEEMLNAQRDASTSVEELRLKS
jgi:hypothetical protein